MLINSLLYLRTIYLEFCSHLNYTNSIFTHRLNFMVLLFKTLDISLHQQIYIHQSVQLDELVKPDFDSELSS